MFEQTIYYLLSVRFTEDKTGTEWKEEPIKGLELKDGKIVRVTTDDAAITEIDNITTFARRATGMFDKIGNTLLSGDIVKASVIKNGEEAKEMLMPIIFVNGAYCIVLEGLEEPIYLNQKNVLEMEKVGNIYQHGKILETPIDEAIFEAQKETE